MRRTRVGSSPLLWNADAMPRRPSSFGNAPRKPLQRSMVCQLAQSPSTRSLARLPRDMPAAVLRARVRSSTPWPRPGRREHATVPVEVLCAHNGTQHQPKIKSTPHATEQPISGSFQRARMRNDPWKHGSLIVRARQASHRPPLASMAQHGILNAQHHHRLPRFPARLRNTGTLQEHGNIAQHTRAHAARASVAHAAASQRRPSRSTAGRQPPLAAAQRASRAYLVWYIGGNVLCTKTGDRRYFPMYQHW